MEQAGQVFDWIVSHWAFCAFVIGMIFEIPSLKLKPFTRLFGLIGRLMTKDIRIRLDNLRDDVGTLKTEVDQVKEENEKQMQLIDMNDANFIRTTILEFANSLLRGQDHTQEEYDHIVDMNDKYEQYISQYKIHNGRFTQAYKYILKCYSECLEANGTRRFLA